MSSRTALSIQVFQKEDRGSVTIIFSLMAIALFMFGGLAVDIGRLYDVRTRLGSAVDSASLAAGRALLDGRLTDAEVVALAESFFTANAKNAKKMGQLDKPQVTVDRAAGKVNISANATVNMTLSRIGGFKTMNVPVTSEAVYKQKDIEVGMALDITGSMSDPDFSGKSKISGLKGAFEKFADKLLPDNSQKVNKVKIALAPYSAGINLGSFVADATYGKTTKKVSTDGCVTEREDGTVSDAHGPFYVKGDGTSDIDPTEGVYGYVCPSPSIVPLSDDKAALEAKVNSFIPNGGTSGHFGVQWAWNLVSDQWTFNGSKADDYQRVKDDKLIKAVVLMTDGIFNTAFHGKKSAQQAIELCNAMKAKGVVVFSVGFEGPRGAADSATLQACASAGTGHFAIASNSTELEAIFENFANELNKLRISK